MDPIKPNFDNTEIAFKGLSNDQLQKADRLFTLFNNPFLVSVGSSLTETALNWGLPIQGIVKSMVFDHFCGGETLEECKTLIDALGNKGVGVLLNFGVEAKQSEEEYDLSMQQNLDAIAFAGKEHNVKALCMKITGFGRFELFEKMQSGAALTTDEQAELDRVNARFDKICAFALEQKVSMYVDAEESWIQDVLDEMTLIRMAKYNKTQAILSNTYQLYRHDVLAHFRRDIERAEKEGFILGAKLVRGAYVEKENEYAKAHQLPSKIHPNKTATDADFNAALRYAMLHIDRISICLASHNEYSCMLLLDLMKEGNIPANHPHISVSQLQGMGDHITFNLAAAGVQCTKYVPYGPLKEVVPYLIRRAQENGSVEGQMGRELKLIREERTRRKA